jgi:hypothetical protein
MRSRDAEADQVKPTAEDAFDAFVAVAALWAALSDDDDVAAIQATSSTMHGELGTDPGFAGRLRERLRIDRDIASRIGVTSKVRVVDGRMIFPGVLLEPDGQPAVLGSWGLEVRQTWALWTVIERGQWVVGGTFATDAGGWPAGTEYLDLPHAPATERPVQ